MSGDPRANNVLVEALGSSLNHGGEALSNVPALLKRVLAEEAWRSFVTRRGQAVEHERFADFVTTPPTAGLGADLALIRRIVAADTEAADLLDQALQNRSGRPESGNNVPGFETPADSPVRPEGNTRAKALRRLRKDSPKLHEDVLAGRLTAHGAMVQAGYRPKTISVPVTRPEAIAHALRRHLDADQIAQLIRLLLTEEAV